MNMLIKLTSIAAALAFSMSVQAQVVDLFVAPIGGQDVETDGPVVSSQVDDSDVTGSIIGGYRDLVVSNTNVNGAGNGDGDCDGFGADCTTMGTFNGALSFGNEPGVLGVGEVQWDGDDSGSVANFDSTGLQVAGDGVDLIDQTGCPTENGCSAFVFTVIRSDFEFDFVIGIYTDAGNFTEFNLAANSGPEVSVIPFAVFENVDLCGTGGFDTASGFVNSVTCGGTNAPGLGSVADLSNVGGMFVRINSLTPNGGTYDLDLQIGSVIKVGVPEPGMVALMGMGLAAAGLVRIRKSRKGKA